MVEHSSLSKLVGSTLAGYQLEQLIERQKMGPVFLARATTTKTACLLRILDIPADLTPEARIVYLGRFQQEANSVSMLQHPSILPVLDYGNYQGMPYLVSPHIPTLTSLHAHLAQYGPVDQIVASRYLDQMAAALEYAHQQAVLHRNLTINSIFLDSMSPSSLAHSPHLVIADFGVMRMLELSHQNGQAHRYYGSSEASTPEQLLGKPVDSYADTYALGALLYRLLTGHRVYTGNTHEEIVQQHLHAPVPPLGKWRSDLSPGLDSIIGRAMAKEPAQRFRQPTELANAYHQLVAPHDTVRPPLVIPTPPVGVRSIAPRGDGTAPAGAKNLKRVAQAPLRPPTQRVAQVSRRRVLFLIVAGGGVAAAAVTTVALFGNHFLAGSTASVTTVNTPVANSGGSTPSNPQATATPAQTGHVLAHTSDIPLNSAKTFTIANHNNPGLLIHLSDNSFVAFDSTCTHTGCAVNYNAQDKLLKCPCHGAAFDPAKNAAVVQGPAPTPLAPVKISVNGDGTITTT
ncbi:MAG: protein kinase domain-containing protein [Ktedonobacteraceae bacterium]